MDVERRLISELRTSLARADEERRDDTLEHASVDVRAKLVATEPKAVDVDDVISRLSHPTQARSAAQSEAFTDTRARVVPLHSHAKLNEVEIEAFANAGRCAETTAALAAVTNLPVDLVERLMTANHVETVLVLAKVAGFSWPTASAILLVRSGPAGMQQSDLDQCLANYERLKLATAEQVVRFHRATSS